MSLRKERVLQGYTRKVCVERHISSSAQDSLTLEVG